MPEVIETSNLGNGESLDPACQGAQTSSKTANFLALFKVSC